MASTLPPATTMDWVKMQEAMLIIEELKLLHSADSAAITLLSKFPVVRRLAELKQQNLPLFEYTWAYKVKDSTAVMIFGIDAREYRLSIKPPDMPNYEK